MRLRNETLTLGLKRKQLPPVTYKLIDCNNVRIGEKWFQFRKVWFWRRSIIVPSVKVADELLGVTIFHDAGTKQFISNSWYSDEEIESL